MKGGEIADSRGSISHLIGFRLPPASRPPALRSPSERRPSERLPGVLRAARIAEVLFFPAACFMLLALPVPRLDRAGEVWSYLIIAAEAFVAAAVYVGLGRRRLWAWVLGMVLAAWVLTGLVRVGRIVSLATLPGNGVLIGSVALFAWTMLAQLVVLGCCLAFIPRRGELR